MSSFHGERITTTVNKLREVCNDYEESNGCGDKTNWDFRFKMDDGTEFWVYDWKEYRWVGEDEAITFHIGADSPSDSRKAFDHVHDLITWE